MTNIGEQIDRLLAPPSASLLREAARFADARETKLYLVGGTVRDLLRGVVPYDIDVTFEDAAPDFSAAMAGALGAETLMRSQFGTAKLRISGIVIDIAMSRSERYPYPGALPEVSPGSLLQDLARRDFTINSMASTLSENEWGQVTDPYGGRNDLEEGTIRALHGDSLRDDATRMLRAVRYAGRFGFHLDTSTSDMMASDLAFLDTIKGDRVRHELERIFDEAKVVAILETARDAGILNAIFLGMTIDDSLLNAVESALIDPSVDRGRFLLAVLCQSIPSPRLRMLAERLNTNREWSLTIESIRQIRSAYDKLRLPDIKPHRIYELLISEDRDALAACALAIDAPLIKSRIGEFLRILSSVRTALTGDDLIALGVPQGPRIGKMLADLLKARMDGEIGSREQESALVETWIEQDNCP